MTPLELREIWLVSCDSWMQFAFCNKWDGEMVTIPKKEGKYWILYRGRISDKTYRGIEA